MKGVVFNLLQQVVTAQYGEDVWDDLLDDAGLEGVYTSLGSYPDAELEALVSAACDKLSTPRSDVLRWFGQQAMPLLAKGYPVFFDGHRSARPFLGGINDIIHAEVRKLYPGAECPHFNLKDEASGALVMDYVSSRRMCALAQGFVEGAAAHYGESVDFDHTCCVDKGDANCVFEIRWPVAA